MVNVGAVAFPLLARDKPLILLPERRAIPVTTCGVSFEMANLPRAEEMGCPWVTWARARESRGEHVLRNVKAGFGWRRGSITHRRLGLAPLQAGGVIRESNH